MPDSLHRRLLDAAVDPLAGIAAQLDGTAVLVTGASGFLAASLIVFLDRLRERHGIALELAASARRPASAVPLFNYLGVAPPDRWQIAAVEDTEIPPERRWIVVHTASFGAPADYMREPLATYQANTTGVSRLFERANANNCARIVYFSTAEVYGQPPADCIPTPETNAGGPDLSDPRSIYGESKRMAEVLGVTLSKARGIPFTVLRPWNVYGPGQRRQDGRVPMEFFRQLATDKRITLLSDGSPRRSFCHVWNAMPQVVACLNHPEASGRAFNIGRQSDEVSILELARACVRTVGLSESAVEFNPNNQAPGMKRCQPDTTRVSGLASGAVAPIALEIGLQTCRDWMQHLDHAS